MKHCKGTYTLIIKLNTETPITVGKLGNYTFKKGFYAYTGSALGLKGFNLVNRLSRHLREAKRLKWHIDYLLASPYAKIVAIVYALNEVKLECLVARALQQLSYVEALVKKFGSTDCKCNTHLHHFKVEGLRRVKEEVLNVYRGLGLKPELLNGDEALKLLGTKKLEDP
ncbi:MAG: GIY-YIG nuclease family protein [Candidatus Nezhaarchaeales archaeon]